MPSDKTLRSYQKAIANFALRNPRCAIWADPGTGKTRSVLEYLHGLYLAEGPLRALVIAPKAVARYTWPAEVEKWKPAFECEFMPSFTPEKATMFSAIGCLTESESEYDASIPLQNGFLYEPKVLIDCINYERIPQWVDHFKGRWPYDVIVADESTKLKGFRLRQGTKRSKALASVAFESPRFVQLTGTPSPNGLMDLWGQFWFLDKGSRLGRTFSAFERRWFVPGYDGFSRIPTELAGREIPARAADLCLSIRAGDYLDTPPILQKVIKVDLPTIAADHYKAMEKKFFVEIEDEQHEAFNAASKTAKLLQMASGAIYTHDADGQITGYQETHHAKLDALADLVDEYQEPLIVSYWYKSDLERLQKRFPQAMTLSGPDTIECWNQGRIKMLLLHPASAGHGLNLGEGGRAICFFSDWWDLEKRAQILERIGPARQAQLGRKEPVLIFQLVAANTLDEAVLERHTTKAEVQDTLRRYVAQHQP